LKLVLEKRLTVKRSANLLVPVLALAFALLAGSIMFALVDVSPLHVYTKVFQSLTTVQGASGILVETIPLLLIVVGLGAAFLMGFWNIGAEGQFFMGAFAATGVALSLGDFSPWVVIPTMTVAAFIFGGLWGLVPAILKAKLGVNEVLTTLMMNYIAMSWNDFLVIGPWRDPKGFSFPQSPEFPPAAQFPSLPGNNVNIGLIFGLLAVVAVYIIIRRTKLGFEVRVIGDNPEAARYAGISYARTVVLVMLISGGLAGIAGSSVVAGVMHRLRPSTFSPGYGYAGIIGAWLSSLNPWGAIPASLLLGLLNKSAYEIQASVGLPSATATLFQSLIFLFLIGGEILKRYRIRFRWGG